MTGLCTIDNKRLRALLLEKKFKELEDMPLFRSAADLIAYCDTTKISPLTVAALFSCQKIQGTTLVVVRDGLINRLKEEQRLRAADKNAVMKAFNALITLPQPIAKAANEVAQQTPRALTFPQKAQAVLDFVEGKKIAGVPVRKIEAMHRKNPQALKKALLILSKR